MRVLRMVVDLTYDDIGMHGGNFDTIAKKWFRNEILGSKGGLSLHSNEIGDAIGTIMVREIKSSRAALKSVREKEGCPYGLLY